ncbi:MAG: phosphoribosyltransferase [Zestosphaera sp.]
MSKFLIPSWEEIHMAVLRLATLILEDGFRTDLVVGILRGGYIVARVLCDLLGISDIGVVEVKFYKGIEERAERPIITQPLTADVKGKSVLVVDDVADSGRTLEVVTEQTRLRGAKSVKTAVLYYKPRSIIKPDYYSHETIEWVVFPWELCEFIRELIMHGHIANGEILAQKLRSLGFPHSEEFLKELAEYVVSARTP